MSELRNMPTDQLMREAQRWVHVMKDREISDDRYYVSGRQRRDLATLDAYHEELQRRSK